MPTRNINRFVPSQNGSETFVSLARVVYVSHGLGMGIVFANVADAELAKLDSWFSETGREF